jgi:hypothetical protein
MNAINDFLALLICLFPSGGLVKSDLKVEKLKG